MVVRMKMDRAAVAKMRETMAKRLPAAMREEVEAAIVKGAEDIAGLQRRLAPRGKTGKLRESIAVTRPGQNSPAHSQPGGSRAVGPLQALVTAGNSEVRYAHLVEFGTKGHPQGGIFKGTTHPGTDPQPFFWPGYRLSQKKVKSRVRRATGNAVRKATGGRK